MLACALCRPWEKADHSKGRLLKLSLVGELHLGVGWRHKKAAQDVATGWKNDPTCIERQSRKSQLRNKKSLTRKIRDVQCQRSHWSHWCQEKIAYELKGTSQLFQMLQEVEEVRGSLDLTTQRSPLISTDVVSIGGGGRSHVGVGWTTQRGGVKTWHHQKYDSS